MSTPIQKLIEDYKDLQNILVGNGEISSSIIVNEHYRKIFLLSCASFYETEILEIIRRFVIKNSKDNRVFEFLNKKAIQRQYHTYFNWDQTNNINQFLSCFGEKFKNKISDEIKKDENLARYVKSFLIIGSERNKMVHGNFLEYKLEKTFEEIISLYNDANQFIEYLKKIFE